MAFSLAAFNCMPRRPARPLNLDSLVVNRSPNGLPETSQGTRPESEKVEKVTVLFSRPLISMADSPGGITGRRAVGGAVTLLPYSSSGPACPSSKDDSHVY